MAGTSRRPSTRLAVGAQRFHARRMRHALVRRDVAMDDDPMRAQSRALLAGGVLAAIAVAGCAVLAVVRPQGDPGASPIVVDRASGALYVRVDDAWHPVFNLPSARLLAGSDASPVPVSDRVIAGLRKGPRLGIPGAPASIGTPLGPQSWAVCDGGAQTTVLVGGSQPALDPGDLVLVRSGDDAPATYLLYQGVRAEVDPRDRAVARALELDGVVPQRVSRALLDTVPEVPAVTTPRISGAGQAGPGALGGLAVGTVVKVQRADADEFYVVLTEGVQRVGAVAADVIRHAYGGDLVVVSPERIVALPLVDDLAVAAFPEHPRRARGADDGLLVCARWHQPDDPDAAPGVEVLTGSRRALDAVTTTPLGQADGAGPRVDAVALPGGRSAYVRATVFGDRGSSGPLFVVTDAGVAFGVPDRESGRHLGLGDAPAAAPWSIVAHLPGGPELSAQQASVVRDGLVAPA